MMGHRFVATAMLAVLFLVGAAGATRSAGASGRIVEFTLPAPNSGPSSIVAGPDGALWFTEFNRARIGRIDRGGHIAEFAVPTRGSSPVEIIVGPDRALWFTEIVGGKIGRIDRAGHVVEFALPSPRAAPSRLTAGRDGRYISWRSGAISSAVSPPPGASPSSRLAPGACPRASRQARTATSGWPSGAAMRYSASIPRPMCGRSPSRAPIAASSRSRGPDGNLWFTEIDAGAIGRISPRGQIKEFPLASATEGPAGITRGPDGNLWFTAYAGSIGRITPGGRITAFRLPATGSKPNEIALGPDGKLWFAEFAANKIGRITP